MMDKDEAVKKLSTVGRLSMSYAEDLYDSFFEKPVVPQYVADWYEEIKDNFGYDLVEAINSIPVPIDGEEYTDFEKWVLDNENALTTLVNMHQFGYEVEKETKYRVEIKGVSKNTRFLKRSEKGGWYFGSSGILLGFLTHTRKELEDAGFGWIFNCPGIEVKEVE